MNVFVFFIFASLSASATLDKSGHLMFVEYSINEPTKDEGVIYVDILFHYKGQTYKVARHRYPEPVTSIVDTFPWVSKDKWEGGDLEVVAKRADGSVERSYISEQSIAIRDLGYEPPKFEHELNSALVKIDDGPDPYAWRMLGYDPGHTGYYPFSLYPPLDSLWMLPDWGHPGSWITDVSGAAGHDMLFIPKSASQWNILTARDIETGEIIWQRRVTANAMTTVLSEGDSILFVGTVIGYTPWKDTTFYALDPFTGKFKWGRSFKTVQESPIVVDSLVYVPSYGLSRIFCVNYVGDTLWSKWAGFPSPVFSDGIVFHTAPDSVLNARDWLTGELLWNFAGRGEIMFNPLLYKNKVIFTPSNDVLYALNANFGQINWINRDYPRRNYNPAQGAFGIVIIGSGWFINDSVVITHPYFIDSHNGSTLWDSTFRTIENAVGGGDGRLLITKDSLLWYPKTDVAYLIKIFDHRIIYSIPMPLNDIVMFGSDYFPIFYKNNLIYANEDYVLVFKTDTVSSLIDDTLPNLFISYKNGSIFFHLTLLNEGNISFQIYDVGGRLLSTMELFWGKGEHEIPLWAKLKEGVYLLVVKDNNNFISKKFFVINRR